MSERDVDELFAGNDHELHKLLQRGAQSPPAMDHDALAERIVAQAALPLVALRLAQRKSTADTLAAWVRVILPAAAAAALIISLGVLGLSNNAAESRDVLADDSDALLSAITTSASGDLASHLIDVRTVATQSISLDPEP
jgi:hypothetical protein